MTREEAIEEVEVAFDMWENEFYTGDDWSKPHEARDMAIRALKQTRWIPVSERLPEVMDDTNGECSDDVLICVADDEHITIGTGFYGYYPRNKSQQGWWSVWAYGCHQLESQYKVIAWQELPEPYLPDINVGKMAESEV